MSQSKLKPRLMTAAAAGALALAAAADAAAQDVQLGGTINVSTIYRTLDPLSWDTERWSWKANHDHLQLESLLRGDLNRGPRGTNDWAFTAADYLPFDILQGSLAESFEVLQNPLRIEFKLRKGVYWQEVPGVMASREVVASDFVKNYEVMRASPQAIPDYWGFVERWEAKDDHTLVFHLKNFDASWDYLSTWGYYDGLQAPEWHALPAEKRADWRNVTGTGPYRPTAVQPGRQVVYSANKNYWDKEVINGKEYQLPLNDKVIYNIIKDESATVAAFTSGRLDILEAIRWQFIDQIKKAAPQVITKRNLANEGTYIALRTDRKPFNDVRVRRAMNLAVDQKAILKSLLNGEGELLNYPFSSEWKGYYQPLSELSPKAQELFEYKPEEAKKLLAEAGYPNGFSFDLHVCSCNAYNMDLVPMLQAYYQRIGVTMNIKALEYGAYRSMMRHKDQADAYMINNASGTPLAVLRKSYLTGQTWNPSMLSDAKFDEAYYKAATEQDKAKRDEMLRELNRYIIEEVVPQVWLPTQNYYSAWWPWVKNYHGEIRNGAMRPNTIYARIWIDQELKKKMGY